MKKPARILETPAKTLARRGMKGRRSGNPQDILQDAGAGRRGRGGAAGARAAVVAKTETLVTLPTLHADQVRAFRAYQRFPRFVLRAGRRYGKTKFLEAIVADTAFKGGKVGWFSPETKYGTEPYLSIKGVLAPLIESSSRTEGVIRLAPTSYKGGAEEVGSHRLLAPERQRARRARPRL